MHIKIILSEPFVGMVSGLPTRYIGMINELYRKFQLSIFAPGNTNLLKTTFPKARVCQSTTSDHRKNKVTFLTYFLTLFFPQRKTVFLPMFNYYSDFDHLLINDSKAFKYDLVYYIGFCAYVYYSVYDKQTPKIGDFCDSLLRHFIANVKNASSFKKKIVACLDIAYLYRVKRKFIKDDLTIIAATEKDALYIQKTTRKKNVLPIPNGIKIVNTNYDEGLILDKWKSIKVLFCGTLDYDPNIRSIKYIMQELWQPLKEICPDAKFDIVGRNPSLALLNDLSKYKDVNVYKDVPDIFQYYISAKLFLAPLFSGGGIKNKILDALSTATPIVTNSEGAIGIELKSGIHGFIKDGKVDLLTATETILNADFESYKTWVLNCHSLSQKYSWRKIGDKLCDNVKFAIDSYKL